MKKIDVLGLALALIFICCAIPAWAEMPAMTYELQSNDQPLDESSRAGFSVGMKVRLKKRDRVLKPAETGHTASLAYGPGQRGEIVSFIRRRVAGYEFDMAIVRWERQQWFEWDIPLHRMAQGKVYSGDDINRMNTENGAPVMLPSFELPAHPETLEPIAASGKAAVAEAAEQSRKRMRALGPPKRTMCTIGTSPVSGQYVIFVRPGFEVQPIADELAKKPGITVRAVWPALASFSIAATNKSLQPLLSDTRLSEVTNNCR